MADQIDVAIFVEMQKFAAMEAKGDDMERDMDLVLTILRTIRKKPDLQRREITVAGYDPDQVGRHIAMLFDAGYVEGSAIETNSHPYKEVLVLDLTWQGHEFYGALVTDEGTWDRVKAAFGPDKLATVPLKMIESVATAALTAWGLKQLGL